MRTKTIGCEKYDLSEIKCDEALMLLDVCMEHNQDPAEAIADLRTIDALLQMKKLHFATMASQRYTRSGNLRKNTGLAAALDSVLEARIRGQI